MLDTLKEDSLDRVDELAYLNLTILTYTPSL